MCVVIIVQNRHCWTITLWVILLLVHYMKLAGVQNEVWNPPHGERFESLVIGLWLSNFTFSQFRRTLYIVYNIVATEIQRKNAANIRFQVPQCIVYISAFAVSPTSSEIRVRTTFNFKAHVRMNPFKGPNGYYMYRQLKHVKKNPFCLQSVRTYFLRLFQNTFVFVTYAVYVYCVLRTESLCTMQVHVSL